MQSCQNCLHWKKQDNRAVFWTGTPPADYGCEIRDIEQQWLDPRAIVEAAVSSSPGAEERAHAAIAAQCPSFKEKR